MVDDVTETIALEDVLFGDVWVCSGQSNMAFTVSQVITLLISNASINVKPESGVTLGKCWAFDFSEECLIKIPTVGPKIWVKSDQISPPSHSTVALCLVGIHLFQDRSNFLPSMDETY